MKTTATGHSPSMLRSNWEGPYKPIRSVGKRAYSLKDLKGKPLYRPPNTEHFQSRQAGCSNYMTFPVNIVITIFYQFY